MRVQEVMQRQLYTVEPGISLAEAARLMRSRNVGSLPVCRLGRLEGFLTDRDIVIRAIAGGCDPKETTVGEIMSKKPSCVHGDEEISRAAQIMIEGKCRRLPVLDRNERLVGIVSVSDLIKDPEGATAAEDILREAASSVF